MEKLLFLSALALLAAPLAAAPDTATCDAKPFTLGKPAAETPKADPAPKTALPAPKKAAPKSAVKPPLLAPCEKGKKARAD